MKSRTIRLASGALVLGLLAGLSVMPVRADVDADVRAGAYTDVEGAMVGGGVLFDLDASQRWYFNPNVEVVFPEDADLVTLNGDFHYDFANTNRVSYWVGAGPAVLFADPDFGDNDADFGANLLAGLGAQHGDVRPFGQLKVTLADDSEAAILFGLRF